MVPSKADLGPPAFCPAPSVLDDLELMRHAAVGRWVGKLVGQRFEPAPAPFQLHAPRDVATRAHEAGTLELTDAEGAHAATVTVDNIYDVDECTAGIAGTPHTFAESPPRPFAGLYRSPEDVVDIAGNNAVTVPVTGALTSQDVHDVQQAAAGRPVILLALTGHGTPDGLTAAGLVRATRAAAHLLSDAHVVAVPAAARAQHAANADFYEAVAKAWAPGELIQVSGQGELPQAVADVVNRERPRGLEQGVVIFLTGLSGSGKSTIAQHLQNRLLEAGERTISLLDGDRVRRHLSKGLGFSKEDRETNIDRIGWVAAEVAGHGGVAICSPIAPFDRTRKAARSMAAGNGAGFVLVHVSTPLAECERRDRKGLYAKARRGEIGEFTGISSPYEEPRDAELTIDTTGIDVDTAVTQILGLLHARGWVTGEPAGATT